MTASVIPLSVMPFSARAARLSLGLSDELPVSQSRGITVRSAAISLRTRAISCSFSHKTRYGFFTEFLRQSIQQDLLGSTLWKVRKSVTVARDAEGEGAR